MNIAEMIQTQYNNVADDFIEDTIGSQMVNIKAQELYEAILVLSNLAEAVARAGRFEEVGGYASAIKVAIKEFASYGWMADINLSGLKSLAQERGRGIEAEEYPQRSEKYWDLVGVISFIQREIARVKNVISKERYYPGTMHEYLPHQLEKIDTMIEEYGHLW